MSVIDTLIFDRTQEDVDRVYELRNKILSGGMSTLSEEEKGEWLAGMKGSYNYTDMNRVSEAVQYIYDRMQALPDELDAYRESQGVEDSPEFHVPYDPSEIDVAPLPELTMEEIPTQLVILVYLANLINLSVVLPLPDDAPNYPVTLDHMTYETANDIERLLYVINDAVSDLDAELRHKIDVAAQPEPDPNVPTYVTEAADDLASRIQNHLSGSSYYLRLAFPTDLHCGWYEDPENVSVTHAGQALKRLRPRLDAVIGGGDYTTGSASTTAESAAEDITAGLTLLDMAGMGEDGLPYFFVLGNHDDAPYRATEDRVNEEAMNLLFALTHLKSGFTMADSPLYGYRDFEGAKIRVICLNTRDTFGWESDETSSGYTAYVDVLHLGAEQLGWLVNTALDFSGKSDAEEWGIIVCSHAPLNVNDTGYKGHTYNTANGMAILSAYRQGASGSVTSDGEEVPYDFTSSPRAQVICCIHGHRHNYEDETVDGILSVGCPNVMDGRERESDDGQTYTKTEDSAEDTSFCVISIDRTNGKIYADHYGAGYDRVWEYTEPEPGPGYTNQIPISTDESGGIYNGTGYKTGVRLNSSGEETEATSSITSGFIPFKPGDVLRVQGGRWTGSGNSYIQLYNAEKKLILPINYGHMSDTAYGKTEFSASDTSVEREMKYTMTGVTIKPGSGLDPADTKFVRISCSWTDGNTLIATVNEEIT